MTPMEALLVTGRGVHGMTEFAESHDAQGASIEWDDYAFALSSALKDLVFDPEIPELLRRSSERGGQIFVGGNGGSALIAAHYVCDFSRGADKEWTPGQGRHAAICMSTNVGYITAVSNDLHYDEVFRQQLACLARPGDIVVLISSSGNSPNVLRAAEYARDHDLTIVAVTGFDGGDLSRMSHYNAHVPRYEYGLIEDVHAAFGHFLDLVMKGRFLE